MRLIRTAFAVGHTLMVEQARALMPLGAERTRMRFSTVQAVRSMVILQPIDTHVVPEADSVEFDMLGVLLLAAGKIREWTDFMLTRTRPWRMVPFGSASRNLWPPARSIHLLKTARA